jgi:streptogramin lyase
MRNWFRNEGGARAHSTRPGRSARPSLEPLEERYLPSGITEFGTSITPASAPGGITRGADANLWFTELNNNAIARITPSGVVTEFSLAALQAGSQPASITNGPNGLLYFTERGVGRLGRINPLAGGDPAILASLTESAIVPSGTAAGVDGITAGPDGHLWFTELAVNRVGDISTDLATTTEFSNGITTGAAPAGIAAGPDGALWFTESGTNHIGRITTGGSTSEFALTGVDPEGITAGPFGSLWFAERGSDQIGRITTLGTVTELPRLTAGSGPAGIALGADGNLWFTEAAGSRVGRITPAGLVTEYVLGITPGSGPLGITAGPDGNLWFTESPTARVGRLIPDAPLAVRGLAIAATAGVPFNGPVATFTDGDARAAPEDFAVTINWGDGTPPDTTTGRVAAVTGQPGAFAVSGTHTLASAGSFNIVVTITDTSTTTSVGGSTAAGSGSATVRIGPNVTDQFLIVVGPVRLVGGHLRRQVVLRVRSNTLIPGPIFLVLDNLPRRVRLLRAAGATRFQSPLGSPLETVDLGGAAAIGPGGTVVVNLDFRSPSRGKVHFTPRILAGTTLV